MAGIDSFPTGSGFTINNPDFKANREKISRSQIPAGIRSAVQDRINIDPTPGATNFIKLEQLQYLTQENTGRLFVGDLDPATTASVLSPFRSVQQKNYSEEQDPSSRYLEVAFSPQNQINDDIVNQIGYFNIGEFIGDVRQVYNNDNKYPDLDKLRDAYFTKYTKSYDLVDFIRLIKFFDNSLFKMIQDFTPSSVSLSSGVVIKQHTLERNRHKAATVTPQIDSQLSASIPVGTFSGGTGGSLERFQTSPKQFHLTQSWDEIIQQYYGPRTITHTDEAEFYTGEYGYPIDVNVRGADCDRFINPRFQEVEYQPVFITTTDFSEEEFLRVTTIPNRGIVWMWWEGNQVKHIKVSNTSKNGTDITNLINEETSLSIYLNQPSTKAPPNITPSTKLPSGVYVWGVEDRKVTTPFTYFKVNPANSPLVIYSEDVDSVDFNLIATGDFIWQANVPGAGYGVLSPVLATGVTSSIPQGYFPTTDTYPREQFFRGWNNAQYLIDYQTYLTSSATVYDPSFNFDSGRTEISTANNPVFRAVYGPSTEPWFMNATASYQSQNSFTDETPTSRPAKNIVGIRLTPKASCNSIDINNNRGPLLGIDFDIHANLFESDGFGLVLKPLANGTTLIDDLILYNPGGDLTPNPSIQWYQPNQPNGSKYSGVADTNIPLGSYGVYKSSTIGNDKIIIDIGLINGRPGVKSIYYCPTT